MTLLATERRKTRALRKIARAVPKTAVDPVHAAQNANLRYVSDDSPGITRVTRGKGFQYLDAKGKVVRDRAALARIKSLVIPPAWRDVWICSIANGHLQVTGRDARGRKQYRYHSRYREVRDEAKYEKMLAFAHALPIIHRRTARDLKKRGLPREKVLAAVVRLMEKTLIRVGNEEYARQNDSYGLTTLQDDHARVRGGKVNFEFKGKSGIEHAIDLEDPRLAAIVRKCQDLPGEELFQYVDDHGKVVDVKSEDVNDYVKSIAGDAFTAKDFRTWAGTVLAAKALNELQTFDTKAQAKKNIVSAVESVAKRLGNTKAVCRKCYIHPAVINSYLDGSLLASLSKAAGNELAKNMRDMSAEEAAVFALLQQLRQEATSSVAL